MSARVDDRCMQWTEDKTACFFRALPQRMLADAKKQCKVGKKAKQ